MSENRDYWKELLGDSFDEEIFRELIDTDETGAKTASEGEPAETGRAGVPAQKTGGFSTDKGLNARKPVQSNGDVEEKPQSLQSTDNGPVLESQPVSKKGRQNHKQEQRDGGKKDSGPEDFEVEFDFDSAYGDTNTEEKPIARKREKRSGCLSGILYAAFVICVSLVLVAILWISATDVLGLGKPDEVHEVTIPDTVMTDGTADISQVADILHDEGFVNYKILFKLYAKFSNADEKIVPGTYELNTNYDFRALVNGMTADSGIRVEVDVTIPEGYTMREIFALLESNKVCTAAELEDAAANQEFDYFFLDSSTLGDANRLEGYLFPDTYTFYEDDNPENVITKMLNNFSNKFTEEYQTRATEMGYSVRDIITVASMIEKEAGDDAERTKIASVIYNRLNNWDEPYLQIDATIFYAIAGTDQEFSTEVDSPYNTYKYPGLPAGPIANPGIASIEAALYPAETDYNYYALGLDGTHEFFESHDAFSEFINSDAYGG
jgi:UPF0755 protein